MSRRYGRNRKRAHRQRIAELEMAASRSEQRIQDLREAYDRETGLLAHMRERLQAARDEIAAAKRELGRFCFALPPETIPAPAGTAPSFQLPVPQPIDQLPVDDGPFHPFLQSQMPFPWSQVQLSTITLHALALTGTKLYREALHVDVELADGRVRYAISDLALSNMSDERFIAMTSASIAKQLLAEMYRLNHRRK